MRIRENTGFTFIDILLALVIIMGLAYYLYYDSAFIGSPHTEKSKVMILNDAQSAARQMEEAQEKQNKKQEELKSKFGQ